MSRPSSKPTKKTDASRQRVVKNPPETVSASWLLKGIAGVVLLAVICVYGSLMILYRLGQWQIVLHPSSAAQTAPAPAGLIRFGPDESGRPQLTGEWIAAETGSRYAGLTILLLPGGDGSRADVQSTADALHQIGINIFSFDYRGYGLSAPGHPSQQRMSEDTRAAWDYLTRTRGIPGKSIVPYGIGVGASLASELAAEHREIPALILDTPHTDLLDFARADKRSSLLPAGLLFTERFAMTDSLSRLPTPKLLISRQATEAKEFAGAATPKVSVELPDDSDLTKYREAVTRFLDQYLGSTIHP